MKDDVYNKIFESLKTIGKLNVDYAVKFTELYATDEEYDELKAVALMGMNLKEIKPENVKVELIDAPDEIKQKYIINKDCHD